MWRRGTCRLGHWPRCLSRHMNRQRLGHGQSGLGQGGARGCTAFSGTGSGGDSTGVEQAGTVGIDPGNLGIDPGQVGGTGTEVCDMGTGREGHG